MLAHADLTERKVGELLKRAVETILKGLEATEPCYSAKGDYLGEKPAWNARARFTQQLLDLSGVIPSRNAQPSIGKVSVNVPTPDWAKPASAKVIDHAKQEA